MSVPYLDDVELVKLPSVDFRMHGGGHPSSTRERNAQQTKHSSNHRIRMPFLSEMIETKTTLSRYSATGRVNPLFQDSLYGPENQAFRSSRKTEKQCKVISDINHRKRVRRSPLNRRKPKITAEVTPALSARL